MNSERLRNSAEKAAGVATAAANTAKADARRFAIAAQKAQKLRTQAQFGAWQTQLSAASKSGDYGDAIDVLEKMLTDENSDGKADNELVEQSRSALVQRLRTLKQSRTSVQSGVTSASVSQTGTALVLSGVDTDGKGNVSLWGIPANGEMGSKPVAKIPTQQAPETIAVASNGSLVAGNTPEGVALWNASGKQLTEALLETRNASAIAFSSDSRTLIVGTRNGTVRVFDVSTETPMPLGGSQLGDYRVSDLEWLAGENGDGHLVVILAGTRQALCGAIPFRRNGNELQTADPEVRHRRPTDGPNLTCLRGFGRVLKDSTLAETAQCWRSPTETMATSCCFRSAQQRLPIAFRS